MREFKRELIKPIKWLSYSNIVVATCAWSLLYFTVHYLFDHPPSWQLSLFVFSSTMFVYTFHRRLGHFHFGLNENIAYDRWSKKNKKTQNAFLFSSFIISFLLLLFIPFTAFLLLLPVSIICLLYVLYLPHEHIKPLRLIPYAKPFIISFCWMVSMGILPMIIYSNGEQDVLHYKFCLILFLYVFAQVILFDFKDVHEDLKEGLITFANSFEEKRVKALIYICLSVALSISFFFRDPILTIVLLLSFIAFYLTVHKIGSQKKSLYFYFILELTLAFPFIFLFFSNYFLKL